MLMLEGNALVFQIFHWASGGTIDKREADLNTG